jgi:cobalt/nickel transport system ATP-binding protein
MAAVIACAGVGYRFPDGTVALDQLDLELEAGASLGLLGANGAGKSTLLQILAGLLAPTAGVVHLDGRAMGRGRADRRAFRLATGLVLQDPDDQLVAPTVWEDVGFGPANLGLDAAETARRTEEALTLLGIAELADRPPHLLSYGQRKRVGLAGALAMRPRLLLLDEPTAGLDPAGEAQLLAILRGLAREHGLGLCIATHAVDLLPGLVDRVAILDHGRLRRADAADVVLADHALLAEARLRPPLLAELLRRLQDRGLLPATSTHLTLDGAEALLAEALRR